MAAIAANFSADSASTVAGRAVFFTDLSTPTTGSTIVYRHWYFSDGGESLETNPSHLYLQPGNWSVALFVVDSLGYFAEKIISSPILVLEDDPYQMVGACDTSIRLALMASQGVGFSLNSGNFPMPSAKADTLRVFDDKGYEHALVYDSTDGLWYDITTREGPPGSGLSASWTDKAGTDSGTDIQPMVFFKEDIGEQDYYKIQHVESHFGFRPEELELRGADGYDAEGFPTGFSVQMDMYADGERLNPSSTSVAVPLDGDIVTNYKVEARRIQTQITANKSRHKLIFRNQLYNEKDVANDPDSNKQTEATYQAKLAAPLFWMSRGENLLLDRVSGAALSGAYSTDVGPDGSGTSAFYLSGPNLYIPTPGTLFIWLLGATPDFSSTGATARTVGGKFPWILYEVPQGTSPGFYLGHYVWFDPRIYPAGVIDSATALYLANDILNFNGKNTLPVWDV